MIKKLSKMLDRLKEEKGNTNRKDHAERPSEEKYKNYLMEVNENCHLRDTDVLSYS